VGSFRDYYEGEMQRKYNTKASGGGTPSASYEAESIKTENSFRDYYEGERARREAEKAEERARRKAEAERRRQEEEMEERRRHPLKGVGITLLQEAQKKQAEAEEKRLKLPLKGTGLAILHETYKQQKAIETELKSRKYPLKSEDGMYFGEVSYDAMKAIQRGTIDKYLPSSMDEANAIRGLKTWAERKARNERISSDPAFGRYGIDPLYFDRRALEKWAKEHHFYFRQVDAVEELLPEYKNTFLGFGGDPIPSKQEMEDVQKLKALAENNERKKAAGEDLGGWQAGIYSFVDATSFGLLSSDFFEDAEKGIYEMAGLPKEGFVSTRQSMGKTLNENKLASFGGNVAGILLPTGLVSKGTQAALGTINGFGKLAPWVQNAIADAITFGSMRGTRSAIAGGDAGDIAADTFRGALGGATGSFARSATDYGLTKLFTSPKVAGKWWTSAKDNVSTYHAKNLIAGMADSGGDYIGDTVAALVTGQEIMSKEELLGHMAVAFIFGTVKNARESKEVSNESRAALENEFIKYAEDYKALNAAAAKARSAEGVAEIGEALIQRGEALKQTLESTMFPGQKDAVKNMSEWIDATNGAIRKKISDVSGKTAKEASGEAGAMSVIRDDSVRMVSAPTTGENVRLTDADMPEYIRTGRRQHTRDEKMKLLNAGESPILYNDADIKRFVDDSIAGKVQGEVRAYGKVGERLARDVKEIDSDTDIYGRYLELTSDKLKHAYDRHSKSAQNGNIDLSIEDFENIAEYIDNYDYVLSVEEHNKAKKIRIAKKINGYTVILSLVSKERSSVHPINMIGMSTELFEQKYLKREKSVGSREETTAKAEPPNLHTAVTHTDHTLSTNSIPTNGENVNGNISEMDRDGAPGAARPTSVISGEAGGNVIKYTPEEAAGIRKDSQTFRNVVEGEDYSIGEFFEKWKDGRRGEKLEKLYLGKVSDGAKKKISETLGAEVSNRDFVLTNSGVEEISKRHGNAEAEAERGLVAVDSDTIGDITEVLNSPGQVVKRKMNGEDVVVFAKRLENGNVMAVGVGRSGRATLSVKGVYIAKSKTPVATGADLRYNRGDVERSVVSGREGAEARADGRGIGEGTADRKVSPGVLSKFKETGQGFKTFGGGSEVRTDNYISNRRDGLTEISDKRISDSDIVEPQKESVGEYSIKKADEYGIVCHVLSDEAFARIKKKADAYAHKGQIYIRENADEYKKAGYVPHEMCHVMKQINYKPYIDFIETLPEKVNMSSEETREIIELTAIHRGLLDVDLTSKQSADFWDEFNSIVYGSIPMAKGHNTDYEWYLGEVFHDLDGYIAEMDEVHERFKKENVAAQLNNNEEAVDANRASTASSAYSDGDGAPGAARPTEDAGGVKDSSEDTDADWFDEYVEDINKREQVIQDNRIEDAENALMSSSKAAKKTLGEKAKESTSFVKRKFVNSGDTVRKIAKKTKDKTLYPAFNKARSASNAVADMIQNKQTDVLGRKVGESLTDIISPIKEKGKDYWRDFQLYLLHKHNVARMSIHDARTEELARSELGRFNKENPSYSTMSEAELERLSRWDDLRGETARKYLELRRNLRKAEAKNKPIFFDSDEVPLNADESRRKAKQLLRRNPDFAENEAKVRKYIDNLMQYRIDSGLATEEEADYFKKKYPDYIPTYRNTEDAWKQITGDLSIGKVIGKAKGGNDPILPLDVALAMMTRKVVRNGQKNMFANKLFDGYNANSETVKRYITEVREGERSIEEDVDSLGDGKEVKNTVKFNKDGKMVELTVTPDLYEAFEVLSGAPTEQSSFTKSVGKINDTYKKLITSWDPTFTVRNVLKDLQDAAFNTRNFKGFVKNLPKAYKEILGNGEMWQLYQAMGGLYSSELENLHEKGIEKKKGVISKVYGAIPYANMVAEQATRLAEFMSVIEKGDINDIDTLNDALLAAAEVTTNFGESGSIGKILNRYYIPFLNPAIQGTAQTVRTFTRSRTGKEWLGFVTRCAVMGLGAGFANDLLMAMFGDDEDKEDYENITDRTKDNYYLCPVGDGEFIKLPKGRVTAALGIVNDRIRDIVKGENVDTKEALSMIAENVLPENPLNNNIFKAGFDADLLNDDSPGRTWYGTDIEGDRLQGLPASERYDNNTDAFSKWLGDKLGVSPKKLNYILSQYTGGIGRMVLPALTPSKQKGESAGEMALEGFKGIWTSSFTVDSKVSNKVSGEFYDAVTKAEQAKNSKNATLADKIIWKHLNRERNMMGEYNTKIRDAEVDNTLTSKERNAAVRAASAERTAYQKTILENVDEYRENVEKYLKEYPGKDENKRIDFAYREANRAMYGAEYAIRVNGGSDVYKKAEEKVKRGKTTWDKYYDEYFGKTERRYEAIADRYDITYEDFEGIMAAMASSQKKAEEIAAIQKLGYKYSVSVNIRKIFNETE